jgi:hypothetical protein
MHILALITNHAVPDPKQDYDTGSQSWNLNHDHPSRDPLPTFAPLDIGLILQPAFASLQS